MPANVQSDHLQRVAVTRAINFYKKFQLKKITELDGLRGFLSIWVVVVHLLPTIGFDPQSLGMFSPIFGESVRVEIFFIISGFVIFGMLKKNNMNYFSYIKGRIFRIYPLFILAFLASMLMSGITHEALIDSAFHGPRTEQRLHLTEESWQNWPYHLLAHATMLHGLIPADWLPNAAYAFLGQAWNISTEFQFYIIAPALLMLFRRPFSIQSILFMASGIAFYYIYDNSNPANLFRYIHYFFIGIFSHYIWNISFSRATFLKTQTVFILFAGILLLDIAIGLWSLVFFSVLLYRDKSKKPNLVCKFLNTQLMQWFGKISYALYLLHMIPLYIAMYFLNSMDLNAAPYLTLLSIITFATAIPLSWAAHKIIEQRFIPTRKVPTTA